jgi:hypothetical protein
MKGAEDLPAHLGGMHSAPPAIRRLIERSVLVEAGRVLDAACEQVQEARRLAVPVVLGAEPVVVVDLVTGLATPDLGVGRSEVLGVPEDLVPDADERTECIAKEVFIR